MATQASGMQPGPGARTLEGIADSVLVRIQELSYAGLLSLRVRPLEVGGILTAAQEPESFADELVPIACGHSFGPCFRLSEPEYRLCADRAAELRASGRRIAAFFRSGVAGRDLPSDYDRQLLRELLPECPVFLLAEPSLAGGVSILAFERGDGESWVQRSRIALPPAGPFESAASIDFAETGGRRAPRVAQVRPPADRPGVSPSKRRPLLLLAVLSGALLAASALYLLYQWGSKAPPIAAPPPLTAELRDGAVRVTWNVPGRPAVGGILEIRDGATRRELSLSPGELAGGSLVYRPSSDDLHFQLRVGGFATNTVRVIISGQPAPQPYARDASHPATQVAPAPPAGARDRVGTPRRLQKNRDSIRDDAPAGATVPSSPADTPPSREQASAIQPPASPQPKPAAELPAPQPLSAAPKQPDAAPLARVIQPQPAAPALRAPEPLRRASPRVPGGLVYKDTRVSVEVRIDERGGVVGARIVSATGVSSALLANACIAAAKDWTFRPAARGGVPVASTHVIEFVLRPPR